jgi:hypothetical protein
VGSPTLFNMYIAKIDKRLEERGIGGIKLGKERVMGAGIRG